jgi:hypothetical protein
MNFTRVKGLDEVIEAMNNSVGTSYTLRMPSLSNNDEEMTIMVGGLEHYYIEDNTLKIKLKNNDKLETFHLSVVQEFKVREHSNSYFITVQYNDNSYFTIILR